MKLAPGKGKPRTRREVEREDSAPSAMPSLPELPGVRHADHELPTGVTLHVAEAGDPAAPAVLAVHGWPQHWWLWRNVIATLAPDAPRDLPRPARLRLERSARRRRLRQGALRRRRARAARRARRPAGRAARPRLGRVDLLARRAARARAGRADAGREHDPPGARAAPPPRTPGGCSTSPRSPCRTPDRSSPGASRASRWAARWTPPPPRSTPTCSTSRRARRPRAASTRHFLLRDLPALARGQGIPIGTDVPVRVLAGRQDPAIHPSQLGGLRTHATAGDLELVDGGHFLVDERPELVADRARAWFA